MWSRSWLQACLQAGLQEGSRAWTDGRQVDAVPVRWPWALLRAFRANLPRRVVPWIPRLPLASVLPVRGLGQRLRGAHRHRCRAARLYDWVRLSTQNWVEPCQVPAQQAPPLAGVPPPGWQRLIRADCRMGQVFRLEAEALRQAN